MFVKYETDRIGNVRFAIHNSTTKRNFLCFASPTSENASRAKKASHFSNTAVVYGLQ